MNLNLKENFNLKNLTFLSIFQKTKLWSSFYLFFIIFGQFLQIGFAKRNQGDPTIIQETDPNSRYICKGQLGDFAACTCMESINEISCINAQFVDADVFLHLNGYYKTITKLTFHGNNFQELPDRSLFGDVEHTNLQYLNLSANYIVFLNSHALQGLTNVRVLDLSNNEIVLRHQDTDFLSYTPLLTHLYFRRAFTSSVNRTRQFHLMMKLFNNANLEHLQYLDLSFNYLTTIPYNLGCPFPNLNILDLSQNLFQTISMNTTCLQTIEKIDLTRNNFKILDENFQKNFANHLTTNSLILSSTFHCDCHSSEYIQWIRSTNVIRDKNLLTCNRASPYNFVGARLVEVPVHKLDCKLSLTNHGISNFNFISFILPLIFTKLLLSF